jgi:homoserine kinase
VKLLARVPATVANLGPGFDCLGLAVGLWNEFALDTDRPPGVDVRGEGAGELPEDATNLVFRALTYVAREAGGSVPSFALSCSNAIPLGRGLGSSAAAVVGGVLLADRLVGADLGLVRILELAVDIEGHADNVAACLLGGLTIAHLSAGGWRAERLEPHGTLRPVLLVPQTERMDTKAARRVLPRTVPLADAVLGVSRSAMAVVALTERPELLEAALEDRLHQPYRLPLMPATRSLFEDLREADIPVCLAGSGPTLLAFDHDESRLCELGPGWRELRPAVDRTGAIVIEG